ncbi:MULTISPECIES: type II toxin-antitoxin system VapB family antitoxin [Phyllobacterium]|jgi:antitoxin VapB|uniref:Transcription factor n=1 Tax=Phyllobacterium sophorae TaxID=1520277 RepID=A0A2P7BLC1_9HYPH|nr:MULTISPECIES: type II toxin-antitoxin system VapB family antitoxin [Phyllobacterium]PSH67268.1 transcription factor [Phyllobacterium sophorae]UXN65491.1 type II toxin-antitoxin system VapB family antitoxin [Phyllobacterium sp. A18/5-2]
MPLYIKDDRIDDLARRYQAAVKAPSKTEAVRLALQQALDEQLSQPTLVEIAASFCRDLKSKANLNRGLPADKAFRDSLYD